MNHMDAVRLSAPEKFLLNELPAELRDEFEEHFFECQECATDLRAGAALLRQVKRELRAPSEAGARLEARPAVERTSAFEPSELEPSGLGPSEVQPSKLRPSRLRQSRLRPFLVRPSSLRPALTLLAIAAMLLVIVYQNVITYPRLRREVASVTTLAILPSISLVGGTSRGVSIPSVVTNAHGPLVLSVDIPTEDRFSSYTLALYGPAGDLAGSIAVDPEQARNTLTINVARTSIHAGVFTLRVQGVAGKGETPVDLARYRFSLEIRN